MYSSLPKPPSGGGPNGLALFAILYTMLFYKKNNKNK